MYVFPLGFNINNPSSERISERPQKSGETKNFRKDHNTSGETENFRKGHNEWGTKRTPCPGKTTTSGETGMGTTDEGTPVETMVLSQHVSGKTIIRMGKQNGRNSTGATVGTVVLYTWQEERLENQ